MTRTQPGPASLNWCESTTIGLKSYKPLRDWALHNDKIVVPWTSIFSSSTFEVSIDGNQFKRILPKRRTFDPLSTHLGFQVSTSEEWKDLKNDQMALFNNCIYTRAVTSINTPGKFGDLTFDKQLIFQTSRGCPVCHCSDEAWDTKNLKWLTHRPDQLPMSGKEVYHGMQWYGHWHYHLNEHQDVFTNNILAGVPEFRNEIKSNIGILEKDLIRFCFPLPKVFKRMNRRGRQLYKKYWMYLFDGMEDLSAEKSSDDWLNAEEHIMNDDVIIGKTTSVIKTWYKDHRRLGLFNLDFYEDL